MEFFILTWHADLAAFALFMLAFQGVAHLWMRRRAGSGLKLRSHVGLFLLTLAGLAIGYLSGQWERDRLRQAVSSLAPTYAEELARMGHEKITADTPADDPAYLAMIETEKRWLKTNNTVADIYTFGRTNAGNIVLLVDSETDYNHNGIYDEEREQRTTIGEEYTEDTEEIQRAFKGETLWMDTPTQDRWGLWVSCFTPMHNARGDVIAVLGIDYPADDWVESVLFHRGAALVLAAVAAILVLAGQLTTALGRAESPVVEAELAADSLDSGGTAWERLRRYRLIGLVLLLALGVTTLARYLVLEDGTRVARHQFEAEWQQHTQRTQVEVEQQFALIYDALRTIASLPDVQQKSPADEQLPADARVTIQVICDNLVQHVAVSDIDIVPGALDPDQPNLIPLRQSKAEIPANPASAPAQAHELKQQIARLREQYARRDSFHNLDYPGLTSAQFPIPASPSAADNNPTAPPMALFYSVPFYDAQGNFQGLIAALVNLSSIQSLLGEKEFTLQRIDPPLLIHAKGADLGTHSPFLELRDQVPLRDQLQWLLQCNISPESFATYPHMTEARGRANLVTFTGIAISVPLAGLIWSLMATRRRAMRLAGKMTAELRQSEARTKAIIDGALDAVVKCDPQGRIATWNPQARAIFGWAESEILAKPLFTTLFAPTQPDEAQQQLLSSLQAGKPDFRGRVELTAIDKNGRTFQAEVAIAPIKGHGTALCTFVRDISELKKAEAEKASLQQQLLDASRQAGMAEIATGVLHNVGNVLNSVNVSACMITEKVHSPEVAELGEAGALLRGHQNDLADYLTHDESGKHVPEYIATLAECVASQHRELASELGQLTRGIEHIKEIVQTQQKFAKASAVGQSARPADVVSAAVELCCGSSAAKDVQIDRDIQVHTPVTIDKHRVLQVLVNLLNNACQALAGAPEKRITIRVRHGEKSRALRFEVTDTGMGIAPENLSKIFQHGFTTKATGHGFGLHSSANAAAEMGGSLQVQSPGPGLGATFTLEIPCALQQESHS